VTYTLRPLPTWPHEATASRRHAQFKSPGRTVDGKYKPGTRINWDETLRLLEYEVWMLAKGRGQPEILIGVGLSEYDIRLDGAPRANARPMAHPGVEISFDSRYGRLTYATDVFTDWRDNVRAVAKGLEALRAVERWGVAKRGEQYAGFALLTAGPSQEELGRQLVERHGSVTEALRATHPDTGGAGASARDFGAVMAFRKAAGA
jgi:hypothetical protein